MSSAARRVNLIVLAGSGVCSLGVAFWWPVEESEPTGKSAEAQVVSPLGEVREAWADEFDEASASADYAGWARTLRIRLNNPRARADEAVLTFRDTDARERFLARAGGAGVSVLDGIDGLNVVRVRVGDYEAFARELAGHSGDYVGIGANAVFAAPVPPTDEGRAARINMPVGEGLLGALGVEAGGAEWGKGVLIAVLDGGAEEDITFGARLVYLDIGYGRLPQGSHGTSVAALAAGAAPGARGVAPGAGVLSIRVTTTDGTSDAFTLARGIFAAVDAGANIVNVSLGGYATSPVLGEAVEYALAAGVAVVAAAGNDQAAALMWPAAYPGVISVGAVDAVGRQAMFSNSGEGLLLTAPGYAVQTAGAGGERIVFSGTSASAPVVSGAVAALMSQTPGLGALEAAEILATHSNDGGAPGADPDYGRGSVNLGWALNRVNDLRSDPAISALNAREGGRAVEVVVQNRGTRSVMGLTLVVSAGGATERRVLPMLEAGASAGFGFELMGAVREADGSTRVLAELVIPAGMRDDVPGNNRAAGVILATGG